MKREIIQGFCVLLFFASCYSTPSSTTEVREIDIAGSMGQLTELKTSDLGKRIRYIPLETTDSCLVANGPRVQVLKDNILITTEKQSLLFDKQTGRFLCEVGHIGVDPEGYSATNCWIDDHSGILHYFRLPDELMKYNQQGQFVGKIKISPTPPVPASFFFTDSQIIGQYSDLLNNSCRSLAFFDEVGQTLDTIPALLTPLSVSYDDIESVSIMKNNPFFGIMSMQGVCMLKLKNDRELIASLGSSTLWESGGKVRYRAEFVDTLYTVENRAIKPYLYFNTGEWHWAGAERASKEDNNNRITVTYVAETDGKLYFQCIKGLYDRVHLYNGVYDKKSQSTKMSTPGATFTDDLTSFLPFSPTTCSGRGEFAALIQSADALAWLEEHPEAKDSEKLAFLKALTEDMNPVVAVLE